MTSAATVAAAIVPALGIGPGAEVRVAMSVVIIGGVLVSTFFSLLVVPCLYDLIAPHEDRSPRGARGARRGGGSRAAEV